MKPQELADRLTKIMDQNGPENCSYTMPKDLKEAFDIFIISCGTEFASKNKGVLLKVAISASLAQGFWLGHDYALEHGQLRGN